MVAGNLFSVAFGRNLDAHEHPIQSTAPTVEVPARQCLDGRECYVGTLRLTIGACLLSMLLSAWAGWRDRQRQRLAAAERRKGRSGQVGWMESEA